MMGSTRGASLYTRFVCYGWDMTVLMSVRLMPMFIVVTIAGCVSFDPILPSGVDLNERPFVAILPFGFDVEITKLSQLKSIHEDLPSEEEARQVGDALQAIQREARWLFLSRLVAAQGVPDCPARTDGRSSRRDRSKARCRPEPRRAFEVSLSLRRGSSRCRQHLGLWESAVAVDGGWDVCGHVLGNGSTWPCDGVESRDHPWQCGLRTVDQYAAMVRRRLFVWCCV